MRRPRDERASETSVRVVMDGESATAPSERLVHDPRRNAKLITALLALSLVAVVLVIAGLRPSNGEAADGSQRQVPTTTTVDTASFIDEEFDLDEGIPEGLSVGLVEGLEPFELGRGGLSIVRGPEEIGGYFASAAFLATSDSPDLYRSLTGRRWSPFETELEDELAALDEPNADVVFFELHRRSSGLAIFRDQFVAGVSSSVEVLASDDGAVWGLNEEQFPDLDRDLHSSVRLIDGDLAVASFPDNRQAVLRRFDIDLPFSEVCEIRATAEEIRLRSCQGDLLEVLRCEFQNAEMFDQAAECLSFVVEFADFAFELRLPDLGDEATLFTSRFVPRGLPVRLGADRFVALGVALVTEQKRQ